MCNYVSKMNKKNNTINNKVTFILRDTLREIAGKKNKQTEIKGSSHAIIQTEADINAPYFKHISAIILCFLFEVAANVTHFAYSTTFVFPSSRLASLFHLW